MKVRLESDRYGFYYLEAENGESIMVQTDYYRIPIAEHFGWDGYDPTLGSDKLEYQINSATEYLDSMCGKEIEDPGLFNEK